MSEDRRPASASATESVIDDRPAPAATAPHLFVVVEAARPWAGGLRLRLDGLDEVVVGRGPARTVELDAGARRARLDVPDRRMSASHARLHRGLAGWELIDDDSKNGSRLDGAAVTRAALTDGALIALGQTVLTFDAGGPIHGPVILDGDRLPARLGVTTLVPALALELDRLDRIAASTVALVIGGETGTGKEVVARAVHAASGRPGPLVAVNCAALPAGLIESQLFGHRRGAFSGAVDDRPGLIRAADGGTLLLDEIGDLPLPAQAALLRVVQERAVVAVGDVAPVPVDLRVIAASHRDLDARVAAGEFRADLLARLAGHRVTLPPLRRRRADVGQVVASALVRHAGPAAIRTTLTGAAAERLAASAWPDNLRGLDRAVEAALILAGGATIDVEHLGQVAPARVRTSDDELRDRLDQLLAAHRGNVSQVARSLGKARMQIQRWLRRFDLDPNRYRS